MTGSGRMMQDGAEDAGDGVRDGVEQLEQLKAVVRDRETRLGHAYRRIQELESKLQDAEAVQTDVLALQREVEARFNEVALLTRMLEARGTSAPVMMASAVQAPPQRSIAQRLVSRLGRLAGGGAGGPGRDVALVRGSGLFNEAWYLERYPDVAGAGFDPVEHYLLHGAAEGRDPSPMFSTLDYLARHPELAASGVNPLVHSIQAARGARNV